MCRIIIFTVQSKSEINGIVRVEIHVKFLIPIFCLLLKIVPIFIHLLTKTICEKCVFCFVKEILTFILNFFFFFQSLR